MRPLDVLYENWEQSVGWNDAQVMTSESSSMFSGLMSTMSEAQHM